jgi:type VI secretion system protein ImpA
MASPPILEFDLLLAPIAGSSPEGQALPFTIRRKLEDARKDINPNAFRPDDPRRPEQFQPADWAGIEEITRDTLQQTSKDLSVAARLTEALVKRHGFAGLRDGLRLMRRLTQDCWDRLYPPVPALPSDQNGDEAVLAAAREAQAAAVEARAGAFNWLDDENRSALFPYTLRTVPLTKTPEEQNYGYQQWKDSREARGPVTGEAFDKAVTATPRDYCQMVSDDIAESVAELNQLAAVLNTRMGEAAPGLTQVRKAVTECQELAQEILKRKGPPPAPVVESAEPPAADAAPAQPGAAAPTTGPRALTRDDVLARLADASALLLQMEPHSPIAYLVQRAVKLARLPLPELMRVLVRDAGVLGQLDRDLDLGLDKQEVAKQDAAKAAKGK